MNRPGTRTAWHAAVLPFVLAACVTHTVETQPIEIKPIHITMDINLRVQRELDEFFAFEEQASPQDGGATRDAGSAGSSQGSSAGSQPDKETER